MLVRVHPHAAERMSERGATEDEVRLAVLEGERFEAKFGRSGFRRNFAYDSEWRGRHYRTKQLEVIAVEEGSDWVVVTVIVKFF